MTQDDRPPILDFGGTGDAIIEPSRIFKKKRGVAASRCVLCFFQEVLRRRVECGELRQVFELGGEGDPNPIYALDRGGVEVTVAFPGLCAPFAAVVLEDLIALGAERFVACGGAGVLDGSIEEGTVLIPTAALRDEGTSYHYQREGRWAHPDGAAVEAIAAACDEAGVEAVHGKVWTTDGVYRETAPKVALRREEGCIAVEMEAAAFFAVSRFRGVAFGQLLYAGDDVSGESWKHRGWTDLREAREGLFELALSAVLKF